MPVDFTSAVEWALHQEGVLDDGYVNRHTLVEYVRQYLNENGIAYASFSALDLEPYLPH